MMMGASPALPQYDWAVMLTFWGVMAEPSPPLAVYSLPEVPTRRSPKLATQVTESMEPEAMRYYTGSSSCKGRDLRKDSKSPVRDM